MKKQKLLTSCLLLIAVISFAQKPKELKKVLTLHISDKSDGVNNGTRGASVAWNPLTKKYYAAMAGNALFPLAIFDTKGKRVNSDSSATLIDVRGLWFDPAKKTICGNGYNEFGWFHYKLDKKGIVNNLVVDIEDKLQPNENSVGCYNPIAKKVYFISTNQVHVYNSNGILQNTITLYLGQTKTKNPIEISEEDEILNDYNPYSLVYSNIKNGEIGVLNASKNQVELYNINDGFLTSILKIPSSIQAQPTFNFAYANETYWFFNIETRNWEGCK